VGQLEKKWIELRIGDRSMSTTERIGHLKDWLAMALRTNADLPDENTVAALDEAWAELVTKLRGLYADGAHPLQGGNAQAWNETRTLCEQRLALVTRQLAPTPTPKFSLFKRAVPPRMYSWVSCLLVLRTSYLAYAAGYQTIPNGFWQLAHALFLRLLNIDVGAPSFKLPQQLPPGADVYRQLLTYSLANPYSLRSGNVAVATQLLDYHCPSVRFLDSAPAQDNARGLVVVALDTDQMPRTIGRAEMYSLGQNFLYIQLHDLTYELQQSAESVVRGGSFPVSLESSIEITRRESVEVVNSILRSFAGIAARTVPRVPASGPIEIICGFYRAWSALSGVKGAEHEAPPSTAEVFNQTITGVAFHVRANATNVELSVGAVVLFRRPSQPVWRISVVRWLECSNDGVVSAGCQAIGLRSDAYTALGPDDLEIPVIVAQVPTHVGDTTVLVPDHGLAADAQLVTREGDANATLILTDLRETHVDCARFHFLTV
jgi:hypothetical protein